MSQSTPQAHYDSPWKAALTHAFRAFVEFYFKELSVQIDWSSRPRFRDKELAQIGFGDLPAEMRADKLVEVRLRNGDKQWVLVHVEVQSQHDAALARRVLDYNYRIFTEYRQPVASLVVLADDDPDWRPQAFHTDVLGTVMGISFATAKLLDHGDHMDPLLASHNPFALVTLAHLRTQQADRNPTHLYAAKWELTKLLFERGWSKRRIITLFRVINWMMALPEPLQARYWRAIHRLKRSNQMEWLDPVQEASVEKAWTRGRKEGAAELLESQLTRRFGVLPATLRKKLARASEQQLVEWGAALLDAPSLKHVFK